MPLNVDALATELHRARLEREPILMLTELHADLDQATAYRVQAAGIELRLGEGEQLVGGKLGFTSRAMREAMGVEEPNYGWLTDAMLAPTSTIYLNRLIHPKVEPEIAFLLGEDLDPPVSATDVLAATRALLPCLEVVDSRYQRFRFRAYDNIADNSSAGEVVLGAPVEPGGIDLRKVGVVVSVNHQVRFTAAGAAALDHPAAAVAWMANACDRPLRAGHVVISGGLTSPVDLSPGMVVSAELDRIGTVELRAA